jgi:hypothetical protein
MYGHSHSGDPLSEAMPAAIPVLEVMIVTVDDAFGDNPVTVTRPVLLTLTVPPLVAVPAQVELGRTWSVARCSHG